jgi:hypothetical protein
MDKNSQTILILLIVFLFIGSIGFNVYQYLNINKLTNQINSLAEGKNQLTNQVSELNSKIDNLGSKIKGYLRAEGEITIDGKNCDEEVEFCLVKLTERLTGVSGIGCFPIADGSCPLWCAAGSDADCCAEKPGYIWIQGRGCYDVSQI